MRREVIRVASIISWFCYCTFDTGIKFSRIRKYWLFSRIFCLKFHDCHRRHWSDDVDYSRWPIFKSVFILANISALSWSKPGKAEATFRNWSHKHCSILRKLIHKDSRDEETSSANLTGRGRVDLSFTPGWWWVTQVGVRAYICGSSAPGTTWARPRMSTCAGREGRPALLAWLSQCWRF